MNILSGVLNWNKENGNEIITKDTFANDKLEIKIQRINTFKFDDLALTYNHKTKTLCTVIGYISNLDEIKAANNISENDDVKIIEALYRIKNHRLISELDGVFTLFIWDDNSGKGYLFQDEHASNLPLYYTNDKDRLVFGTNLKKILKSIRKPRELNIEAVNDFLEYRFIVPDKHTFIKGVHKLLPRQYLVADTNRKTLNVKSWKKPNKGINRETAKKYLAQSVRNNIYGLSSKIRNRQLTCTLSGGFDSNFILHCLTKEKDVSVNAVTIGGKLINEIPEAAKCAKPYKNVNHITRTVDEGRLNNFPDLVWRLEGYVYQSGIFLQNELAETLKKERISSIILGDCADQILDQYRKTAIGFLRFEKGEIKSFLRSRLTGGNFPEKFRESRVLKYLKRPLTTFRYDVELDFILKKNGILLNSYGIQSIYPYINRHTKTASKALGRLNSQKTFFKSEVIKELDESISGNLVKKGGSTDTCYLIKNTEALLEKVFSSDIIRSILNGRMKRYKANAATNPELLLRLLYIHIFNDLFISGKYDYTFDKTGPESALNKTLSDFI